MLEIIEGNLTAILGIISTFLALFGIITEEDKKKWIRTVGISGTIAVLITEIPIFLIFLGFFLTDRYSGFLFSDFIGVNLPYSLEAQIITILLSFIFILFYLSDGTIFENNKTRKELLSSISEKLFKPSLCFSIVLITLLIVFVPLTMNPSQIHKAEETIYVTIANKEDDTEKGTEDSTDWIYAIPKETRFKFKDVDERNFNRIRGNEITSNSYNVKPGISIELFKGEFVFIEKIINSSGNIQIDSGKTREKLKEDTEFVVEEYNGKKTYKITTRLLHYRNQILVTLVFAFFALFLILLMILLFV